MMKSKIQKRIISLLLCISMVLPMIAQPMPVFSVEADETVTDYGAAIGAVAEFKNTGNVILDIEPVSTYGKSVSVDLLPSQVVIKNYYYDEVNDEYWYQIDSAPGNKVWPTDYVDYHWVYADDLTIIAHNGLTIVFDSNGNSVSSVTLPLYQKITLNADSSLQGSVTYQWQIEYEDGEWVNIHGEDEPEITLSLGMIAALLVDNSVNVRCVSTSASKTAASAAILVAVDSNNMGGADEVDPIQPIIEVQIGGNQVTELKMADSEVSYSANLSVITNITGDLTYSWTMINTTGVHVLSDLTTADATITKMNHINAYVERIEDSAVFGATLRVTVSNGTQSASADVAVRVYENAVSDWFQTNDGTYIDFIIVGDGVTDTTVELTQTSSSVVFPDGGSPLLALDITLRDTDGNLWQPATGEEVTISLPAGQLGLEDGDYFAVYHVHDGQTQLLGPYQVVDGYITFEVKGFSEFVFSTNYGAAIGGTAEFAGSSIILDSGAVNFAGTTVWVEDANLPPKVVITNYIFDDYLGKLFYEIDAAPGYSWPADYADLHWCYSDALMNINVNGEAGVYDENGNPLVDVIVSTTESVILRAETSLQSADIDYKWQICYDTVNDLWVDINGETSAKITLTAGMIAAVMDANNQAFIRCITTAGAKSVITTPVSVRMYTEDSGTTEGSEIEIQIDGEKADSVDVNDADKYEFNSVLSASTNLSGTLTYSWEILSDPTNGLWEVLGTEETFSPSFDMFGDGVWIRSYYIHYVDATTSTVTIRLRVSDGVTTLTDTFTINLKYEVEEEPVPAVYSRMTRSASASNSGISTAADTTTTYNVIIQYLDQNGEKVVADPYTSTVSPTTILTNTISFPKVVGYAPMVYDTEQAKWVRQDSHTFDGTPFTSDFTLTVRYYPDAVNYKVNIYIQNAENDEYTLMDSYIRQELTGTVIDKITFTVDGYYQSKFSSNHAQIAADGSTEFNLYYDRIYYLMKFDLDGGYGVQPVYARHGVKLDIPNPTKAGYTFVGWDQTSGIPAVSNELLNDGIANTMYTHMPIGNTAYKAIWKAVDNAKVTIVYWGENPNDEKYSYLESQEIYVKPGTELTFGTDQLVCTLTPHTHGSGCTYNCGKTPHIHTVEAGCYKLTCTTESHNHTESGCTLNCTHSHELNCYRVGYGSGYYSLYETTKPTATLTNVGNGIYTYTTGSGWGTSNHYYLNIGDKWYCAGRENYNGNINYSDTQSITLSCTHGHTDVCYSCGKNESTHVHSLDQNCYALTCQTEAHTHSDTCYSCVAHTHTDDCYLKTNSQNSDLWTYVRSDTVTVAADGSTVMNVYYDRTTFTITFKETNGNGGGTLGTITDKWGADIRTRFENECKEHTFLWSQKTSGDSPWTSFLDVMPQENRTYYAKTTSSNNTQTAIYYGADQSGAYTITLYTSAVKYGSTLSVSAEEFIDIEGYVFAYGVDGDGTVMNTPGSYGDFHGAKFYYDRARFYLEFNNGEGIVKTESVLYEANLGSYEFTPTAPSKYELGSVEFAGWYQNPECTGEEVVLSSTTMPATNMVLYAKWVPVKHNVTIYTYKDDSGLHGLLRNYTDADIDGIGSAGRITHGEKIQKEYIPVDPELDNGNYTFVTWAYYDEEKGEEIEIDLENFYVTKDVEIYAKWSSNVQVPYTIKYMIQGTTTEIAERTEGKQYAGETHTFNAKTAGQLAENYREGYFPVVTSHSIAFEEDAESYEYTFYYVKKDKLPYTVYYVTDQQNAEGTLTPITINENGVNETYYIVADTKSVETANAIVTENFVTVSGYMPDAYQKTLILNGADDAINQIIFKYSVDVSHAYYKVTHYTQQLDGSWYPHASNSHIGSIGDRYTEAPMSIIGFTYDKIEYKVKGIDATDITNKGAILTADGLEINLYYTRNKYPYTVEYREQDSNKLLHTVPELADQYYGESVSHTAPQYFGDGNIYERLSAETLSTTIQTDSSKNLITFYYKEREVTIRYEVTSFGGGMVNPSQETLLISSGTAQGSTAEALPGYKFVGWFDQADNQLSTELRFVPKKVNGLNVAATYYAKFEYNLTSLTIRKEGWQSVDPKQSFLFRITDEDGFSLVVTVHGNGSTTINGLTVGKTYQIEELTDWSWRYTNGGVTSTDSKTTVNVTDTSIVNGAEFTLNPTNNFITFTNTRSEGKWLDGDDWQDNLFSGN